MRLPKLILLTAASLLAVLILAVVVAWLLFDADDYRDDIERIVERETGRSLELSGDLSLTVFPWLGLETGGARLGNAAGFGPEPFLSVGRAQFGVRLLPLVRGRIEIGEILLDRPSLRLVASADGRHNWDDLLDRPRAGSSPPPSIAGVVVRDGRVEFEDQAAGTSLTVDELDLAVGRFEIGRPVPVEAALRVAQDTTAADVSFEGEITTTRDPFTIVASAPRIETTLHSPRFGVRTAVLAMQADRIESTGTNCVLAGLEIETMLGLDALSRHDVPVHVRATRVEADLGTGRASISGLAIDAAGARLESESLAATDLTDAPHLAGTIVVPRLSLRDWLPKIGIDVPRVRDRDALERFELRARLSATPAQLRLDELVLTLDASHAAGWIELKDFNAPGLRFDLGIDRIEVGRYLPAEARQTRGEVAGDGELSFESLRRLDVAGVLAVDSATMDDATFERVRFAISTQQGRVRIDHDSARRVAARAQLARMTDGNPGLAGRAMP